jgi:insulysin
LNYSVHSDHRGIFLVVSGYNDKLPVLAQRVLERVKHLDVKADRLAVMAEQAKQSWRNFFLGKPYEIANYFSHWLLAQRQWTVEEKLQVIGSKSVFYRAVSSH